MDTCMVHLFTYSSLHMFNNALHLNILDTAHHKICMLPSPAGKTVLHSHTLVKDQCFKYQLPNTMTITKQNSIFYNSMTQ